MVGNWGGVIEYHPPWNQQLTPLKIRPPKKKQGIQLGGFVFTKDTPGSLT